MLKRYILLVSSFLCLVMPLQAEPNKYECVLNPKACEKPRITIPEPLPEKVKPRNLKKTFTNKVTGMQFVTIPAGSFYMGSRKPADKTVENLTLEQLVGGASSEKIPKDIAADPNAQNNEYPLHKVEITQPFQMAIYEVTFGQFAEFIRGIGFAKAKKMGFGDEDFIKYNAYGKNYPVSQVSWEHSQAFINWLNQASKAKGDQGTYRLATEAEWEYAARAGSRKLYVFSDSAKQLGDYAWFDGNSGGKVHPVGQKKPNAWGLYDMQGNLWEWVQDGYDANFYARSPKQNPFNKTGYAKVLRGGSWRYNSAYCRPAYRHNNLADYRSNYIGFRLVRLVSPRT